MDLDRTGRRCLSAEGATYELVGYDLVTRVLTHHCPQSSATVQKKASLREKSYRSSEAKFRQGHLHKSLAKKNQLKRTVWMRMFCGPEKAEGESLFRDKILPVGVPTVQKKYELFSLRVDKKVQVFFHGKR